MANFKTFHNRTCNVQTCNVMSSPSPTRKLYWADPCRTRFTAQVVACEEGDRPGIVLNRTLFYPLSGGQPHDTGRLGDATVVDVQQRNDQIVHLVDHMTSLPHEVEGEIDWPRRWDHMQQHSGQHLLSAAFLSLLDRPTIGFHLSTDTVTIDLAGHPPEPTGVERVLTFASNIIAENRPILSYIVPVDAIASVPLRKAPTVQGPVRVVEIADLDWSACGGTHVPATTAIGSIIVTRLEKRGDSTRVYFACGGRATADHRRRLRVTQTLTEQLTSGLDDLPSAFERLRADQDRTQKSLRQLETQLAAAEAERLWATAPTVGDVRLVCHQLPSGDPSILRKLLSSLLPLGNCIAILAGTGQPGRWSAGRSADVDFDLRHLLPAARSLAGVQGGGSADLIQGSIADGALLPLLNTFRTAITESIDARTGS